MFEDRPFGNFLSLRVDGASHAPCLSFSLSNFPAGVVVDCAALAAFMARRAPGRDALSTARREADAVEFVSGIGQDGRTTGGDLVGRIANTDMRPADYGSERTIPRPGHADFPQWVEFGRIPTGGGANSGRLTAALCAAGGLCLQYLEGRGVRVSAAVETIGGKKDGFEETIRAARDEGDSVGGTIVCEASGLPPGLGGALFAGVETELAGALFAIPGVKGVEFGNGFAAAALKGSENNDPFVVENGEVRTDGDRHGGILGGRTSGMPVKFRVALKPTPTIFKDERSVDLSSMESAVCAMKGRHDPCIVLRALPVVEAVAAFVFADILLAAEARVPRICLTLTGKTIEEAVAQFAAERYFTDVCELRVDLLDPSERSRVAEFPSLVPVPTILTFRRKRDGGAFEGGEDERAEFFREVLKPGCGFAYVDFEDDFRPDGLVDAARLAGVKVIRSLHSFDGPVEDVERRCRELRGETDEIPKIAFAPGLLSDVSRLFSDASRPAAFPRILCAMGPMGFASRVLAARVHSMLTYASSGALASIGHVSPHELVKTYRFRSLTPSTRLYGVTGFPLVFTRSPEINNAAFASAAQDAVMVPFPSRTAEEAIAFMRAMGIRGLAVTYPHKQSVMPLLDEIDEAARAIGAVNTVVVEDGRLVGHNTDAPGFAAALKAFLGVEDLRGRRAAIVGAGGAARAVAYALRDLGADACVFNRTPEKAKALADEFGFVSAPLGLDADGMFTEYADVVVQCAAPGGDPEHFDPLAFHRFTGSEWVYDLVYEPDVTPTLARAAAAGCRVENGFSMLCAQAREQRRLYAAAYQLTAR
jgi:3-dehydroquinate dehydratase/shikimate dehydrogenase